jgi:beta-galactosidase
MVLKHKTVIRVCVFVLLTAALCVAETYSGEPSNRVKINLGATPWKFIKSDPPTAQNPAISDLTWKTVGIPHTWNDTDSYTNREGGGATGDIYGGTCWYRKHFTLDNTYAGRKILIEIEGAHLGAAVYINGGFIHGNSALNPNATHVIGFIGFVVDITDSVKFGGADNVLAVRVGTGGFFNYPGFSIDYRFGQGDYGLFRPVWLHIMDKVHVPLNVYSVVNNWGTYVAAVTASEASATIRIMTHVQNETKAGQTVTLTTKVVDATHTVIVTKDSSQVVPPESSVIFDQTCDIAGPHLWYPTSSTFGKPYMYKVYHVVKVGGATVDVFESPLGIRVITWDKDFPVINGHQHYLWGGASRYDYPALGTAVPEEQQWRDAKIMAECGGNLWRPGHSTHSPEFTAACDAYGIMLVQPSGELEGTFSTPQITPDKATLKAECHRDMIVRDRNNPSILAWEVSNAGIDHAFAAQLKTIETTWDPVHTRAQSDRGGSNANMDIADIIACSSSGCEIGMKNGHPEKPCWGAEAWGGMRASRFAYDYELALAGDYVQNWKKSKQVKCFGLVQWYMCETPGESGQFLEGGTPRSFGTSMMDFNRIPKLLYYIFQSCWTPYSIKPVVALAHHWNRSGTVRVNAFSNCPSVRLRINNADQGVKTPNPWMGTGDGKDQNTTQLPFQCWWDVAWQAGTLRAEGLDAGGTVVCFDEKKTSGAPDHIVLSVEPPLVKPDGDTFKITANGSDAAFILAKVVDANGVWCPTASNLITFSVTGAAGSYRGGSDQFVTAGKPLSYHSPYDPELSAEGGMCKVAVRSTFTPGSVTVEATGAGLSGKASTSFAVYPVPELPPVNAIMPHLPGKASVLPIIGLEARGSMLRYFISQPTSLGIDILSANGRTVEHVLVARQAQGWHHIPLLGADNGSEGKSNGVYIVRFVIEGGQQYVKRVLCIR